MRNYQQKVQMLRKEAAWWSTAAAKLAAKAAPQTIAAGGKALSWAGAGEVAGRTLVPAAKTAGHILPWIVIPNWLNKQEEAAQIENANARYKQLLPLNAKMLKQQRLQDALLYGGSSAAGASLAYYLSEKNKGRNAIIGAVAAPIALHFGRGIYNQLNVSPEAYTRRQVGLS